LGNGPGSGPAAADDGHPGDAALAFHPVPPKGMMPQIAAKSSFFVFSYQPKCKRFF
jgi:hypothetical protein